MSQEASYSTTIAIPQTQLVSYSGNLKETPCMEILALALQKLVRDRGGKLDASYTDNEGAVRSCLISARTSDFPRGIGAVIGKDGTVLFKYDAYNDGGRGKVLCDEINQNYNVIAVLRAQKMLGFNVTVRENTTSAGTRFVAVVGEK